MRKLLLFFVLTTIARAFPVTVEIYNSTSETLKVLIAKRGDPLFVCVSPYHPLTLTVEVDGPPEFTVYTLDEFESVVTGSSYWVNNILDGNGYDASWNSSFAPHLFSEQTIILELSRSAYPPWQSGLRAAIYGKRNAPTHHFWAWFLALAVGGAFGWFLLSPLEL